MCVQKREHVDGWRDEQICSLKLLRTSSPVGNVDREVETVLGAADPHLEPGELDLQVLAGVPHFRPSAGRLGWSKPGGEDDITGQHFPTEPSPQGAGWRGSERKSLVGAILDALVGVSQPAQHGTIRSLNQQVVILAWVSSR